jgi:hypothetical protein
MLYTCQRDASFFNSSEVLNLGSQNVISKIKCNALSNGAEFFKLLQEIVQFFNFKDNGLEFTVKN